MIFNNCKMQYGKRNKQLKSVYYKIYCLKSLPTNAEIKRREQKQTHSVVIREYQRQQESEFVSRVSSFL